MIKTLIFQNVKKHYKTNSCLEKT